MFSEKAKKLWNAATTVLVAVVVILALLLAGARLVGYQVFTVLSGSMEPTYPVGSVLYVRQTDPQQIQPGTPITFMLNETTVATHRVVEVVPDEEGTLWFRTKGDANETEDGGLVNYMNVLGTPQFCIPYLGYLAAFIQNPPGSYLAMAVCAVLLILVFLPDLLSGGKKQGSADKTVPQAPQTK